MRPSGQFRSAEASPTGFGTLRSDPELVAERLRLGFYLTAPPDKTLALVAEMDMGSTELGVGEAVVYACPMRRGC